jgi:hypothetical protein
MCYHSGFAGGVLSPILVRPVREQLEHDRIIRLLQAKLKRKHDVSINTGDEQAAPIRVGTGQMFPDLVLTSQDKAKRLEGIIEVETGESVNHLEAMAQWAHFGRTRAPFHLYVPAGAVDIARRLCTDNQVGVAELWSYHSIGDQTRFTLVQRLAVTPPRPPAAPVTAEKPAPKKAAKPATPAKSAAKPAKAKAKAKARPAPKAAKKKPAAKRK